MRSDFIKKIFEKSMQKDNAWKMSRFGKVGAKVSTRRAPQALTAALHNSFIPNSYQGPLVENLKTSML